MLYFTGQGALFKRRTHLEQREGRINRYKCHAIRKNVASALKAEELKNPVWDSLFEKANERYENNCSELVPFWCLPDHLAYKVERIVLPYPFSRDIGRYERLLKIMSIYRLTMGQTRQEDIIQSILESDLDEDSIQNLFINLSPFFRNLRHRGD